ncbi:MAG: hypothetical protein QXS29_06205 [Nitrososphaeria archaeon]
MPVVVRCPRCGSLRIASYGVERTECFRCGLEYKVKPRKNFSRIVYHSPSYEKCKKFIESAHEPPKLKQASLIQYDGILVSGGDTS